MAEKLNSKSDKQTGVNASVLRSLVNVCNGHKAEMDESRGELGAAVKKAEEVHGVHRRAFKLCLTLDRMEDAARGDFLRAFDDYRAKLDLNPPADLFADGEGDEEKRRAAQAAKGAAEDSQAEKNTKALKGIKQLETAH